MVFTRRKSDNWSKKKSKLIEIVIKRKSGESWRKREKVGESGEMTTLEITASGEKDVALFALLRVYDDYYISLATHQITRNGTICCLREKEKSAENQYYFLFLMNC